MGIKNLLKFLFTWWNGNTVGTKLYTNLNGKKVSNGYMYQLKCPYLYVPLLDLRAAREFSSGWRKSSSAQSFGNFVSNSGMNIPGMIQE